ncbi:hypothetical protein [Bradyrhizobium sp. NFR13]|uniref:hypothetical protein n=1 Tax=Bradyrhizobium sp. NFR13 TaxID=1566285 RepID=UPI00336BEDC7
MAGSIIFESCLDRWAPNSLRANSALRRNQTIECTLCGQRHLFRRRYNGIFKMIDTVVVQPAALGVDEPSVAGVSWAAVAAGAVVSLALTLVLIAFGAGLGLSVVSPWSSSVSATTFKITTGIYLIVIAMISSSIGGYLAGRLRSRWIGVHSDEVYFRDTAHGFLAWAFATVLGAVLLASPATTVLSGATSGVAAGATASAAQAGPAEGYIDALLRPLTPAGDGNSADARGELSRIMASSLRAGELKPTDRAYVNKVVAARTGLSESDADKRVTDVINDAKAAADTARKAAMQLAFWLTASLLIGAFSASLAATEGGGLRDGTWTRRTR